MILAVFGNHKPILYFISDHFVSFKQKFRNYAVKIQSLTVKENAPFQIQTQFFFLNCYFSLKAIVILLFSQHLCTNFY